MVQLTDFSKLLIIFCFSVSFMVLVLIFFHFWRKIRKDKLQVFQFSSEYNEGQVDVEISTEFNKQIYLDLAKLKKPVNQSKSKDISYF